MSTLIVEVCEILEVTPHPGADRLDINTIKGWKVISNKNEDGNSRYAPGDKVVYFPPDSVFPQELVERLGVENYVAQLPKNDDGTRPGGGRIKAIRLRGEPSYGMIIACEDDSWEVGTDVKDHYGVTKWEPPVKSTAGDAEVDHFAFHKYTDIENFGNYPDILNDGEEVIVTEKLHGTNCRVGKIADTNESGDPAHLYMAGSSGGRRKEKDDKNRTSMYWMPLSEDYEGSEKVRALLDHLAEDSKSVILFGEIYGSGVQDMAYGFGNGKKSFRAFDISINGGYIDAEKKLELFDQFEIEQVPVLYRGPYSAEIVREHTDGNTTVCEKKDAGKFKGREGVVVTPVKERKDPDLNGRVILKSISADYLARRGGTDSH